MVDMAEHLKPVKTEVVPECRKNEVQGYSKNNNFHFMTAEEIIGYNHRGRQVETEEDTLNLNKIEEADFILNEI